MNNMLVRSVLVVMPTTTQSPITWAVIKSYFRESDIDCMKKAGLDLSDCASVAKNAAGIYNMLNTGRMPPDGKWPQNQIDDFKKWIDGGSSCE
jgi:hypothetical protein